MSELHILFRVLFFLFWDKKEQVPKHKFINLWLAFQNHMLPGFRKK